ncbi:unnamed protein product [Haemonchus placei]|uniref:HTH_48 domain-containing protein n=1 Tax=Haemonchus placei TaxID=6290 RepID=A0A0N4WTE0_HAEPC|nr:unnamed protein product [Haemonchus placei]
MREDTFSIATVHRWFAHFKEGVADFEDKSRSRRHLAIDDSVILHTSQRVSVKPTHHRAVLLPRRTRRTAGLHLKKFLLCSFWVSEGILYYELLKQGHIIIAPCYVWSTAETCGSRWRITG